MHPTILRALTRLTAGLVLSAVLNARTTMQPVSRDGLRQISSTVLIGDEVACTLQDGSRKVFTVTAVDAAALHGVSETVPVTEITRLEIKTFAPGRTVLLGAAVVLAGAAAAFGHSTGYLGDGQTR